MQRSAARRTHKPRYRSTKKHWVLVTLAGLLAATTQLGCGEKFRTAAAPALEAGVNQVLDGLVDGVFAVITPDSNSD